MTVNLETWLFIFGISGIHLESSEEKPKFIFNDATLLSGSEVARLYASPDPNDTFLKEIQPTDCYIAIKRNYSPQGRDLQIKTIKEARERASRIAAVMAFWLFSRTKQLAVCGLADSMIFKHSNVISFPYPKKLERTGVLGFSTFTNNSPIQIISAFSYTRESFLEDIRKDDFKALFDAVVLGDKSVTSKLGGVLTRACERLAIGLYSQEPSEFVVSTITALEILLAENDNKEKIIQKRFTTLVAQPLDKVLEVYKERNNWIHRGTEVSKEQGFSALSLGVSALVGIAALANDMPATTTHTALLNFLDVIALTSSLEDEEFHYILTQMPVERLRAQASSTV